MRHGGAPPELLAHELALMDFEPDALGGGVVNGDPAGPRTPTAYVICAAPQAAIAVRLMGRCSRRWP